MSRERTLVELVDGAGHQLGSSTVELAHRPPGQLHRAFSVLLLDPAGRLLLQRRSATKTRFALRWANTCCGHPAPGERIIDAARQRLAEEIGATGIGLSEIGVYRYQAGDPATGRVEHEYDHVLLGHISPDAPLRPDPDEVAELRWVGRSELTRSLQTDPDAYSPWLAGVVAQLTTVVGDSWARREPGAGQAVHDPEGTGG